jgi:hypothetical protein
MVIVSVRLQLLMLPPPLLLHLLLLLLFPAGPDTR